jgi:molybdopterin molybdotransferase
VALLSVADALAQVLKDAQPLAAEQAPLAATVGRVLAADLEALRTQPPADVSAMDGYAVRAADVATAPAKLKVIGEVAAGRPFERAIAAGETARIFTGGVVPAGADTVVIQEITTREGDVVIIEKTTAKGRNVRLQGLDFKAGDVLLPKGHRLTTRDLALAASMNRPLLPVHRRPKIAVLATGDELVPPGSTPGPGQIVYSNGFSLAALARAEGADVSDLGIVPDRLDETVAAVRRARELGVDVLVTTGGASVGEYDLVQRAFAAEGMALSFWKVALRPGRPLMHGRLGAMQVLGLPGNPVSSYVCAFLFLVPLIRRLSGRHDVSPPIESALLGTDLSENDERADYLRATLAPGPNGTLIASPFRAQDSSMMASLAKADCLVIRAPYEPAAKAGSKCTIVKFEH